MVSRILSAMLVTTALASGPVLAQKSSVPPPAPKSLLCDPLHLIPNCVSPAGPIDPDLAALWAKIINAVQPDLIYAKALADSAGTPGGKLRAQCLGAVIDANAHANGVGLKNADGSPMVVPDPHAVTDAEKLAELIDQLQPTAPVIADCAAAANALKMGVVQFMSTMLVGVAGVVKVVP